MFKSEIVKKADYFVLFGCRKKIKGKKTTGKRFSLVWLQKKNEKNSKVNEVLL